MNAKHKQVGAPATIRRVALALAVAVSNPELADSAAELQQTLHTGLAQADVLKMCGDPDGEVTTTWLGVEVDNLSYHRGMYVLEITLVAGRLVGTRVRRLSLF